MRRQPRAAPGCSLQKGAAKLARRGQAGVWWCGALCLATAPFGRAWAGRCPRTPPGRGVVQRCIEAACCTRSVLASGQGQVPAHWPSPSAAGPGVWPRPGAAGGTGANRGLVERAPGEPECRGPRAIYDRGKEAAGSGGKETEARREPSTSTSLSTFRLLSECLSIERVSSPALPSLWRSGLGAKRCGGGAPFVGFAARWAAPEYGGE